MSSPEETRPSEEVFDEATTAVLIEKYGFTAEHLNRMDSELVRCVKRSLSEIEGGPVLPAEAPSGYVVPEGVIDTATGAVLMDQFGYKPAHLADLQRRQARIWKRTRPQIEIALAAALESGTLNVCDVTEVERERLRNTNIEEFRGEYRFLSNFWPLDEAASDKSFTAEHWYQAEKTIIQSERDAIRECSTPGAAKELSREITVRTDWDGVKLDVMRKVLENKFALPWLGYQLLATGSAMLVEGNDWCDTFWGVCSCPEHDGEGMNWLGLLLMQRRNELRSE